MPYATIQQFIDAYGLEEAVALTNLDDPAANQANATVLTRHLADASALIDSYLSGRYSLPFASAPQVLVPRCLDLARYSLDRVSAREDVRQRYEDAIRWLELVAKGTVNLGLSQANTEVSSQPNLPEYSAPERVFTDESLSGFIGG